jgi:hypothetical protein
LSYIPLKIISIMQTKYRLLALAILLFTTFSSGVLFYVLWRDYLLAAFAASGLLLSGATLLPNKNVYIHGISLGLCLGAFVGGAIGAAKYFTSI